MWYFFSTPVACATKDISNKKTNMFYKKGASMDDFAFHNPKIVYLVSFPSQRKVYPHVCLFNSIWTWFALEFGKQTLLEAVDVEKF